MDIGISRHIRGCLFTVILREDDHSKASIYSGTTRIAQATWDGEAFAGGSPDLLPGIDDSEDVYQALTSALHERAAIVRALDAADAAGDGEALARGLLALVGFDAASGRALDAREEIARRAALLTPEQQAVLASAVRDS